MDRDALGAMSEPCAGASSKPFRRVEVFTGVGRRRRFSTAEKLDLVAQMEGCDNISELARRHDLRPSQLFTWRRELRYAVETVQAAIAAPEPMFVPAVVELPREPALVPTPAKPGKPRRRGASTAVELVIDGVAVKIARGADAAVIAAVIDALKA
jgi:transposase